MEADLSPNETVQFQDEKTIKLDGFDGANYTWWHDKMLWLLTTLNLFNLLDPKLQPISKPDSNDSKEIKINLVANYVKKETDEMLCKGYIPNFLTNRLYDVYQNYKTPKDLWNALEFKYKHMKKRTNRFLALKYFAFIFSENMPIMNQVRELDILVS